MPIYLLRPFVFCVLLAAACWWAGCTRALKPEEISPPLAQYYPIAEGKYRIYHVYDTLYSATIPQVLQYLRRETTNGTSTDATGRVWYRLIADSSSNLAMPNYQMPRLWLHAANSLTAERDEQGVRTQVLKYPIVQGERWDGNALNTLFTSGCQGIVDLRGYAFRYTRTDTTFTVQGRTYTNCLFVQQALTCTALRSVRVNFYEVYAPGVGKILRFEQFWFTQNCDASLNINDNSKKSTDSYTRREELVMENYSGMLP